MPVKYKDKTPEQRAKYLEYQREYKKKNIERFSEYRRNWYETHREEIRAYQKTWRAAHPDYQKQWRAKQKKPDAVISEPVVNRSHPIINKDRCPVCGSKEVGKVAKNTWYCRDCCVEFTNRSIYILTKQGVRLLK